MNHKNHIAQVNFWRRQARQVIEGGLPVLFNKCRLALMIVPFIPIILIIRVLRPLVLVRFGQLNSVSFGMFAASTELYLCERDATLQPKRSFDIFNYGIGISNQQLKKMWERKLHIYSIGKLLSTANSLIPGRTVHTIRMPTDEDCHGVIPKSSIHLFFSVDEKRLGQAGLKQLGLPEGAPFVCIFARDAAYKGGSKDHKWSSLYNQDEELHGYRNNSIHDYLLAAEELVRRGYFVIRMGAVTNEALETDEPMIIDYATKARTDFMDIYLCAHCRFFLGDTGGINTVPRIFRRPVVCANFIPLLPGMMLPVYPTDLIIPKKMWSHEKHRHLTFREFLATWSAEHPMQTHLSRIEIDLVANTPEEIRDVAVEMDERQKGICMTDDKDATLQQRLWSFLEITEHDEKLRPRMGARFLRQNQELLD